MILNDLKLAAGSLTKEHILRSRCSINDKTMFQYAYDPNKIYNIKFNYIDFDSLQPFDNDDKEFLNDILSNVVQRGNVAKYAIEEYCKFKGDLIKLICNKDLDCGIRPTTLNKVFGKGFIEMFEVQLAKEVPMSEVQVPIVGQLKYNGVRVIAMIYNSAVILKTRNGNTFRYPYLEHLLASCIIDPIMLDGELTDADNVSHASVSGIVNSAIKGNPISGSHLIFNVFDAMPLREFQTQNCPTEYINRFELAKRVVANVNILRLADTYIFQTHADIQAKFEEVLAQGFEGLILKRWTHKYTFKRSKDWVKLKAVKTADLMCVGVTAGTGKYEGMIGALVCEGMVDGVDVVVKVGSGLSDSDRIDLNAEPYVGKIIEVKYNTVIQDKNTNNWSLFLPRFVCVRGDL